MKRNKTNNKLLFGIVALALLLLAVAYSQMSKFTPSKTRLSIKSELNIGEGKEYAVCLNGEYMEERAYDDGGIYMPLYFVKDSINNRFYYNKDEENILYSMPYETLAVDYKVLNKEPYILKDDILNHSDVGINIREEDRIVNIITADFAKKSKPVKVKKDTSIRKKGGIKSPILFDVKKDETLFVVEDMEKWAKVVSLDGRVGYVKKSYLNSKVKTDYDSLKNDSGFAHMQEERFDHQVREHKISLGWDLMNNRSGNGKLLDNVRNTKGMNVISPTWFSVMDNDGNIESLADSSYVNKAHDMNLEVWGLLGNLKYNEAKSKIFLHKSSSRKNIISAVIDEAKRIKLDGINLDFEAIAQSSAEDFIQFVRELSIECRKNRLVLSVDNYVPKNFNQYYNRREQGIFADYVIIMGYDEHYSGSKTAGSVASIGFVEEGIDETLKEVDANRIINALPFYMRTWTNTSDGLKSKSISMHQAKALIEKYKLEPHFDSNVGQNFVEFDAEKGFCRVWFEDAKSLKVKMDLIKDKGIGGIAFWRLGLETNDVWDVVDIKNLS